MIHGRPGVVWTSNPGAPIQPRPVVPHDPINGHTLGEMEHRAWLLRVGTHMLEGGVSINRIRLFLCEQSLWFLREMINRELTRRQAGARRWKRGVTAAAVQLYARGVSTTRIARFFCLPPTEVQHMVRTVEPLRMAA